MTDSYNQYGIVFGDSDTLVLLGGEAQSKLRDCSQSLSDIALHDNEKLGLLLHQITSNIDAFSTTKEKKVLGIHLKSTKPKTKIALIKEYRSVLGLISDATTALQIQEAQLIKDNTLLKSLHSSIEEAIQELREVVAFAKSLQERHIGQPCNDNIGNLRNQKIDSLWSARLERRIQDLSISHTISMQMLAQIDLIRENNTKLIDSIISAISGTIPLWQNQMALLLEIESTKQNTSIHNMIDDISNEYYSVNPHKSRFKVGQARDDDSQLKITSESEKIQNIFRELMETEEKGKALRVELIKAIQA